MALLARRFIPAADEVGRLQTGEDEECRLFQKIAEQGHYAGRTRPSSTRQGTYATTADGTLLISWNTNDPRIVASKLRQAIAKWDNLQARRLPADDQPPLDAAQLDRADRRYPDGGLVLRVFTRDLPRDPPQEMRWADSWNQDFAWFEKMEVRQFLPQELAIDKKCGIPQQLVSRLARLHFLDNVRGQTTPFPPSALFEAELNSRVTGIDGDIVALRLAGRTRTKEEGIWSVGGYRDADQPGVQKRGMELTLLGRARYDREQQKFVDFELVGVGTRYGGTQYNVRSSDLGPAPFGVVLTLAGDTKSEHVAPEHFAEYDWR